MQFCLYCSCGSTLTTRDGNTPLSPVFASEREITTTNTSKEEELKASLPHKAKHKTKIPPAAPTQAPHSAAKHQAEIVLSKIPVLSPFWIQPSTACLGVPWPAPPWGFQTQVTRSLPAGTPEAPGCCRLTVRALHGTHRLLPVSEKCLAALQEPPLSDCETLAGADCHYQSISPLVFRSAPLRERQDDYPFPLGFVRSLKLARC